MNNNKKLTSAQREDLLIEWNIYSKGQQEPLLTEFHKSCNDKCSQEDFLQFLRHKLQIDGYWEKVGIR